MLILKTVFFAEYSLFYCIKLEIFKTCSILSFAFI